MYKDETVINNPLSAGVSANALIIVQVIIELY